MKSPAFRIREIAIADIDGSRNHHLPRLGDKERLEGVKRSIAACGQLQAIRVYERGDHQKDPKHKEPYLLCFGARRCAAMEALENTTILATVFPPASDAQIAQARAVENLQRQDLAPLEEVQAVAEMLDAIKADTTFTGDPYDEAATQLGCEDATWVKDRDYLHRLTKAVQKFALRSELPAGHLREKAAQIERLVLALTDGTLSNDEFRVAKNRVVSEKRDLEEKVVGLEKNRLGWLEPAIAFIKASQEATEWKSRAHCRFA